MKRISQLLATSANQYAIFVAVSAAIAVLTGILSRRNAPLLEPFFGRANPLLVIACIALLGLLLAVLVVSREWVLIRRAGDSRGPMIAAGAALLLGIVMVVVDLVGRFPEDINRPFPESLLFYPLIAYVVEVVVHLLPVALVYAAATTLFRVKDLNALWPILLLIAAMEPTLQTVWSAGDGYPIWMTVYVFFHILAFNYIELWLLRRHDFLSMYTFRLVYYAIWHIIWGVARLELLF